MSAAAQESIDIARGYLQNATRRLVRMRTKYLLEMFAAPLDAPSRSGQIVGGVLPPPLDAGARMGGSTNA